MRSSRVGLLKNSTMSYAIIDIGSNSVRLMLWADGKTLYKRLETTRLGASLQRTNRLSDEAMAATVRAVCSFCAEGRAAGAEVFAFATAAVRTASNGGALCRAIEETCGLRVDVVSGMLEAALGAAGALAGSDGGIIDIGGASTEVLFRSAGETNFSVSLNVGAVRLYESCRDQINLLDEKIDEALFALDGCVPNGTVYAIGGTASTLACIERGAQYSSEMSGTRLTVGYVHKIASDMLDMTAEERKKISGMEEKRADIIAGGTYLLAKIMEKLGLDAVVFSDADNLEGYLRMKIIGVEKK